MAGERSQHFANASYSHIKAKAIRTILTAILLLYLRYLWNAGRARTTAIGLGHSASFQIIGFDPRTLLCELFARPQEPVLFRDTRKVLRGANNVRRLERSPEKHRVTLLLLLASAPSRWSACLLREAGSGEARFLACPSPIGHRRHVDTYAGNAIASQSHSQMKAALRDAFVRHDIRSRFRPGRRAGDCPTAPVLQSRLAMVGIRYCKHRPPQARPGHC